MISLATDSESFLTSESYGPENISVRTPLTTQNLIVVACVQASPYPPKGKGSEASVHRLDCRSCKQKRNEPITVLGNARLVLVSSGCSDSGDCTKKSEHENTSRGSGYT